MAAQAGLDPATAHADYYPYSEPMGVLFVSGAPDAAPGVVDKAVEILANSLAMSGWALERVRAESGTWGAGRLRVAGVRPPMTRGRLRSV